METNTLNSSNTHPCPEVCTGGGYPSSQDTSPEDYLFSPPQASACGSLPASGQPQSATVSGSTKKPSAALSDSLRAAVDALAPLHILGDDLYEEILQALFKSRTGRQESQTKGMLYNPNITPALPFLFRDREARAWYVFECINGLTSAR